MVLLIIQLFNTAYEEEVALAISSAGIEQTSCIEAINMEDDMKQLPLFSGFFKRDQDVNSYSKLYIASGESPRQGKAIIKALETAGVQWSKDNILKLMVIPIATIYQ